jgi:hypothetical protein
MRNTFDASLRKVDMTDAGVQVDRGARETRRRRSAYVLIGVIAIAAGPAVVAAVWGGAAAAVRAGTAFTGAGELVSHPLVLFQSFWSQCWWYVAAGLAFGLALGGVVRTLNRLGRPHGAADGAILLLAACLGGLVMSSLAAAYWTSIWIQYPPA